MTERLARAIAAELDGTARMVRGTIWCVDWEYQDGRLVVMYLDGIYEWPSRHAYLDGDSPAKEILFRSVS